MGESEKKTLSVSVRENQTLVMELIHDELQAAREAQRTNLKVEHIQNVNLLCDIWRKL